MSESLEGVIEEELPRGLYAVRAGDGRRWIASLPVRSKHTVGGLLRGDRVVIQASDRDARRARIVGRAEG